MTKQMPLPGEGMERKKASRFLPTHTEQAAHPPSVADAVDDLYLHAKNVIRDGGGIEATAAGLDREPSYAAKISEGINRRNGRTFQLDWLGPHLENTEAMLPLISFLCERAGLEPPVEQRVVTPEQQGKALLDVVRELPEEMREPLIARAAKRLGVKPERLKKI